MILSEKMKKTAEDYLGDKKLLKLLSQFLHTLADSQRQATKEAGTDCRVLEV